VDFYSSVNHFTSLAADIFTHLDGSFTKKIKRIVRRRITPTHEKTAITTDMSKHILRFTSLNFDVNTTTKKVQIKLTNAPMMYDNMAFCFKKDNIILNILKGFIINSIEEKKNGLLS